MLYSENEKIMLKKLGEQFRTLDYTKSDDELYKGAERFYEFIKCAIELHKYIEQSEIDGTYKRPKRIPCKGKPYRIEDK